MCFLSYEMKLEMCWVLRYHKIFSQVFQNCKLGNTITVVYVNFFHIIMW